MKPTLFQTIPVVRDPQRRRDPFGFSEVATFYADLLAPDLTNRQLDARWLTILCWSLQQVKQAFDGLDDERTAYERLRGLELRWVIQACRLENQGKERQLAGSRTVRKLMPADYRNLRQKMGKDQWRRYRHIGPYAAYRGLLQHLELLEADGWTLTPAGLELAAAAAEHVPHLKSANVMQGDDENGWIAYWLRRWPTAKTPTREDEFLPGPKKALLAKERTLIAPKLFATGERRRAVADCMRSSHALSHAELCGDLQRQLLRRDDWTTLEAAKLGKLEQFAHLADAAINALRQAYKLTAQHKTSQPLLHQIATDMELELEQLDLTCKAWRKDCVWLHVDQFAAGMIQEDSAEQRLQRLLRLHEQSAGGLLWLKVRDGKLNRVAQYAQPPDGYYRFRLNALARLARGCKVITALPTALRSEQERKSEQETADEDDQKIA